MRLRVFRCVSLPVPFCARSSKRQLTHPNRVTLTDVALMLGVSTDVGDSILGMGERSYHGAVGMPVGSPRLRSSCGNHLTPCFLKLWYEFAFLRAWYCLERGVEGDELLIEQDLAELRKNARSKSFSTRAHVYGT